MIFLELIFLSKILEKKTLKNVEIMKYINKKCPTH